jgi:hypothetical protein
VLMYIGWYGTGVGYRKYGCAAYIRRKTPHRFAEHAVPYGKADFEIDAVGSVHVHPYQPLILSCSGSRSYLKESLPESAASDSDSNSESETSNSSDEDETARTGTTETRASKATMRIWSFADSPTPQSNV